MLRSGVAPAQPRHRSAQQSLPWTALQAFFQVASRIAALVILSWLLSPAIFGQYGIVLSITLILATIAQLGIPTNLICLDDVGSHSLVAALVAGLLSSIAVAAVYVGVIIAAADQIDAELGGILLIFAAYIPMQVLLNTLDALGRRLFAFKAVAICELAGATLGNLIVSVALAYHGWGVWSLIAGQVVSAFTQAVGLLFICRDFLGYRTSVAELRKVMSASFSMTVAEVANIATVHAQRPLIGMILGPASAGLWARFYQIILLQLTCLIQPVDRLVIPTLVCNKADSGRTQETMLMLIEIVSLVTIPVSAITAVAAPLAITLAFGPAWHELILPLQIGSITLFFRGLDRILLSAARATGHMKSRAVLQVGQLAIVSAAILVAAPYGLPAVAFSYVVSQLCGLAAMLAVFSRGTAIPLSSALERIWPGSACGISILFVYAAVTAVEPELTSDMVASATRIAVTITAAAAIACSTYRWGLSSRLKAQLSRSFRRPIQAAGPAS